MTKDTVRSIGLALGPVLALLMFTVTAADAPGPEAAQLSLSGRVVLAMMIWMATWWLLEAIPVAITALLPLLLLPISGVQKFGDVAVNYGHPIIFLALGGFALAAVVEKWQVHQIFANWILAIFGSSQRGLLTGFMLSSAFLSMWISNTATSIIMLPIALSLIARQTSNQKNFTPCLLLAICYACSMGGMTTLIGTTTNMFFAGYMQSEMGLEIGFLQWMMYSGPIALIMLGLIWLVLSYVIFPLTPRAGMPTDSRHVEFEAIKWNRDRLFTCAIFVAVALAWICLPLLRQIPGLKNLSMYIIAVIGLVLLFIIPAQSKPGQTLLDWPTANAKIPWGVLILIGGGLALAKAVSSFGVSEYLAFQVSSLNTLPVFLIFASIITLMVFLTELTSNVASATALTPVFASLAVALGLDPIFMIASITLAASCAFMLPVATPPNAVIFGSGEVKIQQMVKAGLVLNLSAILVISFWCYLFRMTI